MQIIDHSSVSETGISIPHDSAVRYVEFSPDGKRLLTCTDDVMRISNPVSGEWYDLSIPRSYDRWFVKMCPDGKRIILRETRDRSKAAVWDIENDVALGNLRHQEGIEHAIFSPNGQRILVIGRRAVTLWDALTATTIGSLKHEAMTTDAKFSADGLRTVTTSTDGTARVWSAKTGAPINAPLHHLAPLGSAEFIANGTRIITRSQFLSPIKCSWLWSYSSTAATAMPIRDDVGIRYASFSPQGLNVISFTDSNGIRISSVATGSALHNLRHIRLTGEISSLSPDLKKIVYTNGQTAYVLNCLDSSVIRTIEHKDTIHSSVFSPDGSHIATASFDTTCRITNVKTGDLLCPPLKHDEVVLSAAFSPDGKRLVTGSRNGIIRLWDASTGRQFEGRLKNYGIVRFVAFNPKDTRIVALISDAQDEIQFIDASFNIYFRRRQHSRIESITFSSDGSRILLSYDDGAVKILDSLNGAILGAPLKHATKVERASFSPDGQRVVTTCRDGTVRVWDANTSQSLGSPVSIEEIIALSGCHVADNGQLEWLPGPEWMALINKVKAQAQQGTTKKDQLMRWHFSDPATRTISPFSQITVPQHIEREIDWVLEHPQTERPDGPNYSPKILDDAYNLDPGHPLILLALSVFEDRPETKALWKRLSFPRFEKDARLAARAAEILLIDKDPENARKAAELALDLPSATDADKAKARAVLAQIGGEGSKP